MNFWFSGKIHSTSPHTHTHTPSHTHTYYHTLSHTDGQKQSYTHTQLHNNKSTMNSPAPIMTMDELATYIDTWNFNEEDLSMAAAADAIIKYVTFLFPLPSPPTTAASSKNLNLWSCI